MKSILTKIFTALVFISIFSVLPKMVKGDHLIGGELTYEYIGDSTGIPHHYRVNLVLHRTTRWTTFSGVLGPSVCVRSSCFPNQNVPVSIVPGTPTNGQLVPGQTECINSEDPDFTEVIEHFLTGTVQLGGTCSDFRFSYAFLCCRIGIVRITNYSGQIGNTNYLEARLNNTQGENTSAQFLAPPAKSFCTNNFFNWSQATIEPDNDSLYYDFGVAMNGPSCGPGNLMTFAAPFSRTNPIPTVNPIFINQQFGIFEFETTGMTGDFIVVIDVIEYRLHPTGNFYYEVGRVMREMLINIVGGCRLSVQDGPQFDGNIPGQYFEQFPTSVLDIIGRDYMLPNMDSTADPGSPSGFVFDSLWPVIEYQCFDSIINLVFSQNIQCPTISDDVSEFRMVAPDCTLVPITSISPQCNAAQETQEIILGLHQPLAEEGDYFLYIKEGTDGNTLLNACGFPMAEYTTIVIRVVNCREPEYNIKNVSVLNDDHIRVYWEPDPASFPTHAITGWYFFRSDDDGATFNRVGSITNGASTATNWIDYSVENQDVNAQTYRYQLQMEVGGTFFSMTRDITSILLEEGGDFLRGSNTWNINWNEYDGWVAPEYHVMIYDRDSNPTWTQLNQANNPTFNTSFDLQHAFLEDRRGSVFGLRVDAHDASSSGGTYISESNILYFEIPTTPIPPSPPLADVEDLNIPNVFTPNGDGENDIFLIKGLSRFRNAEVIITNRWGNVVYRSNNFQNTDGWDGRDMKTGQMVSDGTYFYIINLKGSNDGSPDIEESGSLTVFGAGTR